MIWGVQEEDYYEEQQQAIGTADQDCPQMTENDFIKLINLEERYNYLRSLMKIQRLNDFCDQQGEKGMLGVMLKLSEYYAQCISEAENNIENIIQYFQQKMKDINAHYKQVVDKQTQPKPVIEEAVPKIEHELGNIDTCIPALQIQEVSETTPPALLEKAAKARNSKTNLNKNLMMALQNQNIEEHIAQSNKKAAMLKKSIADSIHIQEEALNQRRIQCKKKRALIISKTATPQTATTTTSFSGYTSRFTIKRKQDGLHKSHNSYLSSDSQLDEAESMYIQSFVLQGETRFSKSLPNDRENC